MAIDAFLSCLKVIAIHTRCLLHPSHTEDPVSDKDFCGIVLGVGNFATCTFFSHSLSPGFCNVQYFFSVRVQVFPLKSSDVTSPPPPPLPPTQVNGDTGGGSILRAEARCVCGPNSSSMPRLKAGRGISVGLMLGQMSLCGAVCPQTMGP